MVKKVILNRSGTDKIRSLNPWIYHNEIKKVSGVVEKGDVVYLYSPEGELLGTGYINPESKISVRVLAFFKKVNPDMDFVKDRVSRAFTKRIKILDRSDAIRIVHSEADGLPGLIVDMYGKYLSIQVNTAGMERLREYVIDALVKILDPEGIIERSDERSREKEGLQTENKIIYGKVPESIIINENNVRFYVHLEKGQKTGFYLDQRINRYIVSNYIKKGDQVLDLFSNSGGFGIYAGVKGAGDITFVDISRNVKPLIEKNCELNNIKRYTIYRENVFKFLTKVSRTEKKYDLIVLDPPSFAKNKHEAKDALRGFKFLVSKSLEILREGGLLAVFSCSYHISMEDLKKITLDVSKNLKYSLEIVKHLFQDEDHPYLLNIPASLYLKGLLIRKNEN
ncbi:class I SAM-dependent rRNA methyltransferase [Persephonella sp.]